MINQRRTAASAGGNGAAAAAAAATPGAAGNSSTVASFLRRAAFAGPFRPHVTCRGGAIGLVVLSAAVWIAIAVLSLFPRPPTAPVMEPPHHSTASSPTPIRSNKIAAQWTRASVAGGSHESAEAVRRVLIEQYLTADGQAPSVEPSFMSEEALNDAVAAFESENDVPVSSSASPFSFQWRATSLEPPTDRSSCTSEAVDAGHLVIGFRRQNRNNAASPGWYAQKCAEYVANADQTKFAFQTGAPVDSVARALFGPDWFEATVLLNISEPLSSRKESVMDGVAVPLMFAFDRRRCVYVSTRPVQIPQALLRSSGSVGHHRPSLQAVVMVDWLYSQWNALRETEEEGHYDYTLQRVPYVGTREAGRLNPHVTVRNVRLGRSGEVHMVLGSTLEPSSSSQSSCVDASSDECGVPDGYWVSLGPDPIPSYPQSHLKGYWLTYKTMQWSDYAVTPTFQYDYLGRMNYGRRYGFVTRRLASQSTTLLGAGGVSTSSWSRCNRRRHPSTSASQPSSLAAVREQGPCRDQSCLLELLRNRRVYFFGDSHMRIFFYGFLSRLGVSYPLDKVWRGDRVDVIASHNVTVSFVASYFLNFSRPSALAMMRDETRPIVIAGVGQHHSCHCWAVSKHMGVVRESLRDLLALSSAARSPQWLTFAGPTDWQKPRDVVWFGTPAQPFNTHLYRKKPVGQSRRDCRNNARHVVYSAFQSDAITAAQHTIKSASSSTVQQHALPTLTMLDAFRLSFGMQHTSLDGAHYYTWAREAWIDALVDAVATSFR